LQWLVESTQREIVVRRKHERIDPPPPKGIYTVINATYWSRIHISPHQGPYWLPRQIQVNKHIASRYHTRYSRREMSVWYDLLYYRVDPFCVDGSDR
jgi:hypothetical protein